eukprot:CAMPEP_0113663000 /NCGR_PEP_ID=MMETSP0038_2-20120614/894_1 /TAXON_ID=2898 /ORGANISM="Cryptomonas paramecium" /LENGTH=45 /DNA_ID=CAMNT_0000577969 /DNA_START=401 /DNA_END=538 /DNA_ORIENTATION=- /assembly_acc=CAM_ASM_000170
MMNPGRQSEKLRTILNKADDNVQNIGNDKVSDSETSSERLINECF